MENYSLDCKGLQSLSSSGKKKKKSNKSNGGTNSQAKNEDFEKLRTEAIRLNTQVSSDQKPYYPKTESDSKIIKFKQVPKNQCLYCT